MSHLGQTATKKVPLDIKLERIPCECAEKFLSIIFQANANHDLDLEVHFTSREINNGLPDYCVTVFGSEENKSRAEMALVVPFDNWR